MKELKFCDHPDSVYVGENTTVRDAMNELAALRAEKVSQCGHPSSLMLRSAETGKALYCELCDERKRRRDAESMEERYKARAEKAEAERDALRAAGEAALRTLDSVRVFVTSRERIHKPSGEEWFEGCVKALRIALGANERKR